MKPFKQFILEFPMLMDIPKEEGPYRGAGFLKKPISGLVHSPMGVFSILKPNKIGNVTVGSGEKYTIHHAVHTEKDPFLGTKKKIHHIFLVDNNSTVVGYIKGNKIGSGKSNADVEHIGLDVSVLLPAHRGKGLYGSMLKTFIKKRQHVVYSGDVQSLGSMKAWKELAKNQEADGLEIRVHPDASSDRPGNGMPWNKELPHDLWVGAKVDNGRTINPEKILLSARNKVD